MRSLRFSPGSLLPGLLAAIAVAMAAAFLSAHYNAPVMLFALLLGMAFNFLSEGGRWPDGIEFASTRLLRVAVALLGFRISFTALAELGLADAALVVGSIALTLAVGWLLARLLGLRADFGILTGGAVAICGASAALAIAAVLPRHAESERNTLFAVIGVTTLSTLAMIAYPLIVAMLALDDRSAGIFLGATIHDVAQVVAAGYTVSTDTGDLATLTKLLRVAMLIPVVLAIAVVVRRRSGISSGAPLPWFVIAFAVFMALSESGIVPAAATLLLSDISRWLLITAIAALGMKTRLQQLFEVGPRAVSLMVLETLVLALVVVLALLR